jgi:hypothetical protein
MNDNFSTLQFQKNEVEKTGDWRLFALFLQFSSSPVPPVRGNWSDWSGVESREK